MVALHADTQENEAHMNLVRKLKEWWASTEPVPDVYDPSAQDYSAEELAEFKKRKRDIDRFVAETFDFLSPENLQKLQRRVSRAMKSEDGDLMDSISGLVDGLEGDFFSKRRIPYLLTFDARYAEEVALRVNTLCHAYGISGEFSYDEAQHGLKPIPVLETIQKWLRERDFDLVTFDSGGDRYLCFIVPTSKVGAVVDRGQALGIRMSNVMSDM